jgi:cytochrome c oxidase assembly protein subunit 15
MDRPWLHRYSIVLAVCSLALVVTGAFMPMPPTHDSAKLERIHQWTAVPVVILAAGLAIWLSVADKRVWLRRLGWIVLATVILQGALGSAAPGSRPPGLSILHACLAQLFFAATVAIAVFTSRDWWREPELVKDQGWPSFRSLSIAAPSLVLLQVVLGASYRHGTLGVMPHLLSAMIVALVILAVGVFVTQQFPEHRSLRPAAIALMSVTFVQVALGLTVLIMPAMAPENSIQVVLSIVAHVTNGALTLAASVVMSLQIRRNVRATLPQPAGTSPAAANPAI